MSMEADENNNSGGGGEEANTSNNKTGGGNSSPGDGSAGEVVIGSAAMRPLFFGNLFNNFTPDQVIEVFEHPTKVFPPDSGKLTKEYQTFPVDRIDLKRGYCFVFLKDAKCQKDKDEIEEFVKELSGIEVPNLSKGVRVEFARGDGRVKRKEDERRKNIAPSETLFVVNFHEERTRKEDLQMLFQPYGDLVRIDMKKNYAFVQFKTIEQAKKAKETTNGGKLDQSVLTVEYVANQRHTNGGGGRDGGGGGGGDRRRRGGSDRGDYRYDSRRRDDDFRRGGSSGGRPDDRRGGGGRYYIDRYDDRPPRRYDDYNMDRGRRDRASPPPPPPYRSSRRGSSRSRSPPPRYGRSRSPPTRSRYDDRYDDYRGGGRDYGGRGEYRGRGSPDRTGGSRGSAERGPSPPPNRSGSPGDRDPYRAGGGDRDRGYRG